MKIQAKSLYKILLFLLVILPIYQDSPLSLYLGAAGYTLLMPFVLALICIYVLVKGKLPYNQRLHELVNLGIWMVIVSYLAIIVWVLCGNEITIVSEFLPFKALKVCMQYFSYPAYVALVLIACRKVGVKYIGYFSYITLLVITAICLIEKQQSPYAFESLHFSAQFPYWRIRLLTPESSWTAMMIYIYTLLSLYWSVINKKNLKTLISLVCAVVLVANTGSRALMMAIAITAVLYVIIALKKLKRRTIIYLLVVALVMTIFVQVLLPQIATGFAVDIQEYTSLVTRTYTSIIGLGIGICFPFGVGGAVYLGVFQNALSKFLYIFSKLPIQFNTSEIVSLATRTTGQALTVKSGILHFNMYWGILGSIYLMRNFFSLSSSLMRSKIQHKDILMSAFWCTIVLLIGACNFTFEFWLLYAFLLYLEEIYTKEEKVHGFE